MNATTRIVPLKYVAAAEMRRVIEPMVGQGAILRVDDQRNLLVVSGTGSELANLDSLVAIFDADWMRQMSFRVRSSSSPAASSTAFMSTPDIVATTRHPITSSRSTHLAACRTQVSIFVRADDSNMHGDARRIHDPKFVSWKASTHVESAEKSTNL
jgi:type II secretory pathway component GspD/PulD (secretin)